MSTMMVKVTRLIPETVEVQLEVVAEADFDGTHIFFVTREEALRVYLIEGGDETADRLRNYELEGYLREWAGVTENQSAGFCINSWCPFNGAWDSWTRYMPLEKLEKLSTDPEVGEGPREYLKRVLKERRGN